MKDEMRNHVQTSTLDAFEISKVRKGGSFQWWFSQDTGSPGPVLQSRPTASAWPTAHEADTSVTL